MNITVIFLLKLFSTQNLGRMISLYVLTFITSMLGSCEQKEDPASRPYPRLTTLPVEQTTQGTIFSNLRILAMLVQ
ncbi:hypothetical protein ACFPQ1_26965 [Rhodocytophaga aerolata]|uniref:hypothetical protein n=1 Tax=Rhodocytophaga aerolata TaxID=455078 RepID=UPI00361BA710